MTQAIDFKETEPKVYTGVVESVEPGSLAEQLGLQAGDEVLAVNGHPVQDVIDVQYYAAEDEVEIVYRRATAAGGSASSLSARGERADNQALGLNFIHPTFDIDIRRCNNLCPFCFVLQTAPRMRRTLYIKDDDYRYSFLYGHFVTLTNLSARDWHRIEEQHLSPLFVSVHSTDLENRRACLANKTAPDILEQLRWLAARGIEIHTQLVLTPGLNDGAYLEKSVRDLAALYPAVQSISVVPVGLTQHHKYGHRAHTRDEAKVVLRAVHGWQRQFRERFGAGFVYPTDEWFLVTGARIPAKRYYDDLSLQENGLGMVRDFLDEWRRSKRELFQHIQAGVLRLGYAPAAAPLARHAATLVTATLFAPTLAKAAAEFDAIAGTALTVVPVLNDRLGHGITVAGLLMGADVIAQLRERALGAFVVLPRVMFDHPDGISLDDVPPLEIARALGRPVVLADCLGDVLDAFTGRNRLTFDPAAPERAPQPMKAGGWSVEKYL
jgi:putative radical SAM enzyme (TIGR03279 family)